MLEAEREQTRARASRTYSDLSVQVSLTCGGQLSVPVVAEAEHLELPAEGVDVGVRRHLSAG